MKERFCFKNTRRGRKKSKSTPSFLELSLMTARCFFPSKSWLLLLPRLMSAGGTDGSMVHFELFIQPNSTNGINCLTVRAGNGALCMWMTGTPHHHSHLTGQWGTRLRTGKGGNRESTAQDNAWVTLQVPEDAQRLIQPLTWLWHGYLSTVPLAVVLFLNTRMAPASKNWKNTGSQKVWNQLSQIYLLFVSISWEPCISLIYYCTCAQAPEKFIQKVKPGKKLSFRFNCSKPCK